MINTILQIKDFFLTWFPNIRFKEFTDEWEVKKLGEVCLKIGDGLHGTPNYVANTHNYFINGNNIINGIIQVNENTKKVSEEDFCNNNKKLNKNSLLISINGTIGNIAFYNNEKVMLGKSVGYLNFDENPTFVFHYLQTYKCQSFFTSQLTGTTIKNLSLKTLRETPIYFPCNSEQTKIANFLTKLDERISAQRELIKELEKQIKGYQQKLFSREIRFKDNNENDFPKWNISKLEDFLSIPKKETPKNIEPNKLLSVKLHLKGVQKNTNTESLAIGSTKYYIRKKGQFIYGKQNLFNGAFGIIPDCYDNFLSSGDIPTLDINNSKVVPKFFLQYFSQKNYYKSLEKYASGSGSKRIHEKTLFDLKIQLPCLEEQTKIANFLSVLDNKLKAEKDLLKEYENQKKYFLQNMFV